MEKSTQVQAVYTGKRINVQITQGAEKGQYKKMLIYKLINYTPEQEEALKEFYNAIGREMRYDNGVPTFASFEGKSGVQTWTIEGGRIVAEDKTAMIEAAIGGISDPTLKAAAANKAADVLLEQLGIVSKPAPSAPANAPQVEAEPSADADEAQL